MELSTNLLILFRIELMTLNVKKYLRYPESIHKVYVGSIMIKLEVSREASTKYMLDPL
jgi:hypothetical protein